MSIDVHAHFLPPSYVAALSVAGIDRPDGFPHVPRWSTTDALARMDSLGITAAVLSISSPGVGFAGAGRERLARSTNEEGADIVRDHPRRFGVLASLPLPDIDAALAEVARAGDDLGLDGFLLLTNYDGVYLGDPRFDELLSELNRRRAVVALHPTSPPGWEALALDRPRPILEFPLDTTRTVFNLILSGALERFPDLRFIVPHAGAALPALVDRVQSLTSALNDHPIDIREALGRLWFDLAGGPYATTLPSLLAVASPGRLLYGSDMPFSPPALVDLARDSFRSSHAFTDEQRHAILHENPLVLFPRLRV